MTASPIRVQRLVAPDHPAFDGHFPGRPLLPGALVLAEVLEAVAADAALSGRLGASPTVVSAKFTAAVPPGSMLEIVVTPEAAPRGAAFEVRCGARVAASGRLAGEAEA